MAVYQARWTDPVSGKPKRREFHSKKEAVAFRDLPRLNPAVIDYVREPKEPAHAE